LRALYQSLGLNNVQSLLQSGNLVFESEQNDREQLTTQIEAAIEKVYGFRPKIILRNLAELKEVIDKTPFNDGKERDPSRLMVTFLLNSPNNAARESLQQIEITQEELHVGGQEIYIYYTAGVLESKLDLKLIEKKLNTSGTTRNWNTVTKLLKLAESVSSN
jgi:uncharacterized protein (DUF1697 family)